MSHPLLANRPDAYLFIDESGTGAIGNQGIFALGGVLISAQERDSYIEQADALKLRFFGRTDFSFHEPDMRTGAGPLYHFAGDVGKRDRFDREVDALLAGVEFTVFGAVVRKGPHRRFVEAGLDPYLPTRPYAVAIEMLMERVVDCLWARAEPSIGRVRFESIGPAEDVERQYEYTRLLRFGTQWIPHRAFSQWLAPGVEFDIKGRSGPTEIADMFVRDLFEWARDGCVTQPKRWAFFSSRIYKRGDGGRGKFGVKVFPDSDIRSPIESHRNECMERI